MDFPVWSAAPSASSTPRLLHAALDKAFGGLDVVLLCGGVRMTRIVDPD